MMYPPNKSEDEEEENEVEVEKEKGKVKVCKTHYSLSRPQEEPLKFEL